MERTFKQKRAADAFVKKMRANGLFATAFEEPTDSQASTKRGRAKRRYIVRYDTGHGLMNTARRGGRKPTKAQKRANASKRSKQRRVAASLKKFLSSVAPAKKYSGAALRRNPGGSITITPLKAVKKHR
jgi:hypothetical protein